MMRRLLVTLVAIVSTASLLPGAAPSLSPSVAHAASFFVTNALDLPDVDPTDGVCLASNGTCTLRAAVMQANASPGADGITLPSGTFTLTIGGANEDLAATGDLDVTDTVTIAGTSAAATIIDGNALDRVFDVQAGTSLTLNGVTVRNGSADNSGGGGIRNAGGLGLQAVVVTSNMTTGNGGGIHQAGGVAPTLVISNSSIALNRANGGSGIGAFSGTATITGSGVSDNGIISSGIGGGGIYVAGAAVTISGTTIARNRVAGPGGGIAFDTGALTLTDVTLEENQARGDGGGLAVAGRVTATLTRIMVRNNRTLGPIGGSGGGVSGSATIADSTFAGNEGSGGTEAGKGSGGGYSGIGQIANTTFTGNKSSSAGGGLLLLGGSSIVGSTIIDNEAGGGGGIALSQAQGGGSCTSAPTLNGVIVKNNRAPSGGGVLVMDGGFGLVNVVVEANTAGAFGPGGGILINPPGSAAICGSTISANIAGSTDGGGIAVFGSLILQDSTVSGNTSTGFQGQFTSGGGHGGGLVLSSSQIVRIRGVTIAANKSMNAPTTGADNLHIGPGQTGAVEVANTIVSNATARNCAGAGFTSHGHNLSSDGTCPFNAAGDLNNSNPQLGSLANNGGTTKTHALQSGSPAIDAGDNALCSSADQRGEPRPRDGDGNGSFICDIGAFETAGAVPPTATPTRPPTPLATLTPTPVTALCNPRPRVTVQTNAISGRRLQAVISVTSNPGQPNAIQSIIWGTFTNATVEVVGIGPVSSVQQTGMPAGTPSVTFVVSRVTPAQPSMVQLTVTDACGGWPTFVGGGRTAF